jgi:hypothetical protein
MAGMALSLVGLVGCSMSSDAPSAEPTASTAIPSDLTPQAAVGVFLEAVRTGDDARAAEMLTETACKKTREMNMVIAPPGSKTAQYEVGECEMVSGGAHVAATWSDLGDDGKRRNDTIVWILREQPQGWRIAGMATKLFNDQPPLILNFEDPQDMVRKQQLAEQEMERRMKNDPAGLKAAAAVQSAEVNTSQQLK